MEKTISTSNYDVIVVRHRNQTFKSTPFQAVFSQKFIKMRQNNKKTKLKDLQLFINDQCTDVPIRIDPTNGRVQFQKKYIRKVPVSDSSDISDDDRSQRSNSRERLNSQMFKGETIEQLKNEQAPKNFWQFAWLFNGKNNEPKPKSVVTEQATKGMDQSRLARIKEQPYEGEQSSNEPLFQMSLCRHLLAKRKDKQTSKEQQLQRIFYANKVEYKEFIKDPLSIINDANLILRIDNSLYTWQLGAAVLACKYAFGVQPQSKFVDSIIKAKSKKSWFPIFGADNDVTKLDIEKGPTTIQAAFKQDEQEIVRYRKAPDSQMLSKMKLKMGQNKAKFTLQVSPGQIEQTEFRIYLWDENEKVVISDIDGTITRSDVMGQLKTNYIHKGVCLLFNEIYRRNYKIIYMTARAIGQYNQTRKFLVSEAVENGVNLPPGPLFMSPDGYIKSFTRQVIEKNPDQLKIKLLASINQIFPNTKTPIIAGFGNRQTDSIAYLRIKIPAELIFCISEKSVITNEKDPQFSTTYPTLLEQIDQYFPVYAKPEGSEASNLQPTSNMEPNSSKDKNPMTNDENEDPKLQIKRKMSHDEFLQLSPRSQSKEMDELQLKRSRVKSQQGNLQHADFDNQRFIQEYLHRSQKSIEQNNVKQ